VQARRELTPQQTVDAGRSPGGARDREPHARDADVANHHHHVAEEELIDVRRPFTDIDLKYDVPVGTDEDRGQRALGSLADSTDDGIHGASVRDAVPIREPAATTVEEAAPPGHPWTTVRAAKCEACRVRRSEVVPAPALVLGAIASVQSGAAIATKLFADVGPGGAVFLRLVLSAILVTALVRPRVRATSGRDLVLVVGFGLVLAAMNALFYASLDRIPLGVAVTFEFLGPLSVAIGGSRRAMDVLWAALAAAGVVLLTSGGGSLDAAGVELSLAAGVCWAGYILLSQRVGRRFSGMSGLAVALMVGSIGTAPYGIVAGGTHLLRPSVVGKGAAIAVLSSAIPYSLELAALRRLRAATFGVLMSVEPAMAAVCGAVFLSQHLRWQEWLAIGAVMTASIGATMSPPPEAKPVEVLG